MIDAASMDALGAQVVRPPFLAYLDIVGDPLRATTWETSIGLTGTGDPDLDDQTFSAVNPSFVDIGSVVRATGGSDAVTLSLSGIVGPDSALLDLLGDPGKWKGRLARLWFMLLDENHNRIGGVFPYYTGRMMGMSIKGSAASQTVELTVESYLASLTAASNRTYLDQHDYDGNDSSAGLTIAVANGAKAGSITSGMTVTTGGIGGSIGAIAGKMISKLSE